MLAALASCGGSSGAGRDTTSETSSQEDTQEPTKTGERGSLTAAKESSLSNDAIVLATRDAKGPGISVKTAESFDRDLEHIREEYPRFVNVHARPAFVLDEMLVSLEGGAPWSALWRDGKVETGDAKVDTLLDQYKVKNVRPLLPGERTVGDKGPETFVLRFEVPLNIKALADKLESASGEVRYAEPNATVGGGDDIVAKTSGDGSRKYVFSRGSGDCAAGCIERRSWTVTLEADGSLSVRNSGGSSGDGREGSERSNLIRRSVSGGSGVPQ